MGTMLPPFGMHGPSRHQESIKESVLTERRIPHLFFKNSREQGMVVVKSYTCGNMMALDTRCTSVTFLVLRCRHWGNWAMGAWDTVLHNFGIYNYCKLKYFKNKVASK